MPTVGRGIVHWVSLDPEDYHRDLFYLHCCVRTGRMHPTSTKYVITSEGVVTSTGGRPHRGLRLLTSLWADEPEYEPRNYHVYQVYIYMLDVCDVSLLLLFSH